MRDVLRQVRRKIKENVDIRIQTAEVKKEELVLKSRHELCQITNTSVNECVRRDGTNSDEADKQWEKRERNI